MRILITLLMVVSILFSGLTSYAFGKKKAKEVQQPEEQVESVVTEPEAAIAPEPEDAVAEETTKSKKDKKAKKEKKEKAPKKESQAQTMPTLTDKQTRQIEYVDNYYNALTKNRSKFAKFMNPNLDIREVRASHILVKNRKDAVQIKKDIMSGTITFEEAARQYSLCPSAMYGGDLGFFDRKKMAQQFADTAFDLKIGEISDPVGTKFGWHIIKTTDKR